MLEALTPEDAVKLPLYYDEKDKGRNLIHKCTHLKLQLMLEDIIQCYRRGAMRFLHDDDNTSKEIRKKNREIVHKDCGAWVDSPTLCENGFYPMHYAAYAGDMDIMKVLTSNGGSIDVVNKHGLSPMHVAAQGDKSYPIAYLYENGLSVDAPDKSGQTPLHWACYQGGEEAIYYLLAWLKDINHQDNQGKTPLHNAIENITKFKQLRPIKEMLIKGASREARDHQGLRALDLVFIVDQNSGLSD